MREPNPFRSCLELLDLVRCTEDGGTLVLDVADERRPTLDGTVRCEQCSKTYPVCDGILLMLSPSQLSAMSRGEQEERDRSAPSDDFGWEEDGVSRSEIASTLAAVGPVDDQVILELGCGRGRFTAHLQSARSIVAVDFSVESLRSLARRPGIDSRLLLVCADVSRFQVRPGSFDLVFSTLTSNLPTREHRDAMHRLAGKALRTSGRFVLSAHAYGPREWLRRDPKEGFYAGSRIFRRLFSPRDIETEMLPFFRYLDIRRIQVILPLLGRIGLGRFASPRLVEGFPVVNSLAALLLVTARDPRGH